MTTKAYDGIICFGGGDWWYHNRGHYDMQMMKRFSRIVPVMFVNSLGMRVPRPLEGRMFFKRVARKLRSLSTGFKRIDDSFGVLTPLAFPGRLGMRLTRPVLARQIRSVARRMGMSSPLVWVSCPPGAEVLDDIDPLAVIYERTDRYEAYPGVNVDDIRRYDRLLKERADITLYCSTLLIEEEGDSCRNATYVDHGVDYEAFASAGRRPQDAPDDIAAIASPRVGFVGGIDAHTFDVELFKETARLLPDTPFVLVGGCSLPEGTLDVPNVTMLGRKPYEEVPRYMAACDVLIMPWNDNEWVKACNPVKLKEYLAVGRPVVTTDFEELKRYEGFVRKARTAREFADQIQDALEATTDPEPLRARVKNETWDDKTAQVVAGLGELGFAAEARP